MVEKPGDMRLESGYFREKVLWSERGKQEQGRYLEHSSRCLQRKQCPGRKRERERDLWEKHCLQMEFKGDFF